MRHVRTKSRIDQFVDGEITESMQALVERHLEECPQCTYEVAVSRAMKEALAKYGDDPAAQESIRQFVERGDHRGP